MLINFSNQDKYKVYFLFGVKNSFTFMKEKAETFLSDFTS